MIIQHFVTKYDKFINSIQAIGPRDLDYFEMHHIKPRCMGGSDNPSNLIKLSFREHFLAHWMLYLAYPKNYKLAHAFHMMCNVIQNVPERRREMRLTNGINGRSFERLKRTLTDLGAPHSKGVVSVVDLQTNQKVRISCVEYSLNSDRYVFHTKGMTACYNLITNTHEYIPASVYQANKDKYMATTKFNLPSAMWKVYDPVDQQIKHITYSEYQDINQSRDKKDKLLKVLHHKLKVIDETGEIKQVTIDEYKNGNYEHVNKSTVKVFDTMDQTKKSISKFEYESDPCRYLTSTKGKVLAYDTIEQKNVLIDKSLFDKNRYVGQTKNLTSVFDKIEQRWVQISRDQAKDKTRYQGPCSGKINVINKASGLRSQILKSEFDPEVHISLGDKRYYFKATYLPKNKIKNIHIYEWHLLDHSKHKVHDVDMLSRLQQTYLK